MPLTTLQPMIDYIEQHSIFFIFTHENPDGDTVGSALALSLFLKRLGKTVYSISKGPFNRTEIKQFAHQFLEEPPLLSHYSKVGTIIVDCSSLSRTGFTNLNLPSFKVIDHHTMVEEESGTGFIDGDSPSTTLLVAQLIQHYQLGYTPQEAYTLLFGFCTDTDFFRHLHPKSAPYLVWVRYLMEAGANPSQIFDQMQGTYSLASRRYTGQLLNQVEDYFDGKYLVICEDATLKLAYGTDVDRDADTLYRLLLSVENVEVVAIIKESDRGISVGLRAKNAVNVALIASKFGGGGHIKASGFLQQGSLLKVKQELHQEIKKVIYT